jgi:transposase-like protein
MSVLSQSHFHDEAKAYEFLEGVIWADGIACPHCGTVGGRVYDLSSVRGSKSAKNPEGAIRHGLKKCGECRKQFTVKVGTVFEHARMPLYKMLQAVHLIVSSKKGISAHQLSRILEVQYKTAWFLAHRIREAMRSGDLAVPFGSTGGAVEVDETYIGFKKGAPHMRGGWGHKHTVLALVDRESGKSKWFHIDSAKFSNIQPIVLDNIHREARLMTDEARVYMPDVAANAFPIAFGNFRNGYLIAERSATTILRDPYTNKPFVHFYATKRIGGQVLDSDAIKLLKIST